MFHEKILKIIYNYIKKFTNYNHFFVISFKIDLRQISYFVFPMTHSIKVDSLIDCSIRKKRVFTYIFFNYKKKYKKRNMDASHQYITVHI